MLGFFDIIIELKCISRFFIPTFQAVKNVSSGIEQNDTENSLVRVGVGDHPILKTFGRSLGA